jgi:hypothetical protein
MFNHGTTECERWGFEYLEVPVACECYLSKVKIKIMIFLIILKSVLFG